VVTTALVALDGEHFSMFENSQSVALGVVDQGAASGGWVSLRIFWKQSSPGDIACEIGFKLMQIIVRKEASVDASGLKFLCMRDECSPISACFGDKDTAFGIKFKIVCKFVGEVLPDPTSKLSEGKLGAGKLIRDKDIALASATRAASDRIAFDENDFHTFTSEKEGAGGANDATSNNDYICIHWCKSFFRGACFVISAWFVEEGYSALMPSLYHVLLATL